MNNEQAEAEGLIKEVKWLGCEITLKNGKPVISGDKSAITPDLIAFLKARREHIIQILSAHAGDNSHEKANLKQENIASHFYVSAGRARADNRLTGDGPCSVCGCQEWYKRADDYDPPEGWACMICHPCPPGVNFSTPKNSSGPYRRIV